MCNAKTRIADAEAVVEDLLANVCVLQDVVVMRWSGLRSASGEMTKIQMPRMIPSLFLCGWLPSRQTGIQPEFHPCDALCLLGFAIQ